MADLFTRQAPADNDDVISEHGDFSRQPVGSGSTGFGGASVRRDATAPVLRGLGPVPKDPRKYRYDVMRAGAAKVSFEVTRDDRMSAQEAGDALHALHVMFGVHTETEDLLGAFDAALWFCHTVNSGSTLVPGRSKFVVAGESTQFDYKMVVDKLGIDMRRFFRAYADDITQVNRRVLSDYNPYDPVSQEMWGWLQEVAHSRGLHRYPYLAHDSADACLKLNSAERSALAESKRMVISSANNSADRLRANDRVRSADGHDSTLGSNV